MLETEKEREKKYAAEFSALVVLLTTKLLNHLSQRISKILIFILLQWIQTMLINFWKTEII